MFRLVVLRGIDDDDDDDDDDDRDLLRNEANDSQRLETVLFRDTVHTGEQGRT